MTDQPPAPPADLPLSYASGLERQSDETLEETREWLVALLEYRRQPVDEAELPDDAEVVDQDSDGGETLVKEKVTCGDETCHCADGEKHGPYLYSYKRVDGKLVSEYEGKP